MNGIIYKITCLTNLHVGNGESNFDIIDNAVEKDPVTGLPTINSSGVKGAFRQYFKEHNIPENIIISLFGSTVGDSKEVETDKKDENGESQKSSKTSPGKLKFYQADLLARPVRATNGAKTNYMVTSHEAIVGYNTKATIFNAVCIDENNNADVQNSAAIGIEGVSNYDFTIKKIDMIDGECTIIVKDSELKNFPLPVLARNQLEDGISKNLWYEEVVPHKSIFTFAVSSDDCNILNVFVKVLGDAAYVQFGGNASIGYGLCKVEKITSMKEGK